jgi:hypothetical protein
MFDEYGAFELAKDSGYIYVVLQIDPSASPSLFLVLEHRRCDYVMLFAGQLADVGPPFAVRYI